MFRRKNPVTVAPGDRFEKLGNRSTFWTVEVVLEHPDHPTHVRLVENAAGRKATVALSVLSGPEYRRVEPEVEI